MSGVMRSNCASGFAAGAGAAVPLPLPKLVTNFETASPHGRAMTMIMTSKVAVIAIRISAPRDSRSPRPRGSRGTGVSSGSLLTLRPYRARAADATSGQQRFTERVADRTDPACDSPPVTTEIDLLRAIAADPDDLALRRVHADWLIEHGSPRGELVQLELALEEMDDFDEQRKTTKARIAELYELHGAAWMAPFAALRLPGVQFTFDRGVVGGVRGTPSALAAAAPRILAGAPLITSVAILVGDDRDLSTLTDSPLLPRIRSLILEHFTPVRPTGWSALVLPEVRSISLLSIAVGPDDSTALLAPPNVPKLASFTVSNCRLNRGALDVLARGHFPLEKIDIAAGKQERLGEWLGNNAAFHGLRLLRIPGNPIGSKGFRALLPALRHAEVIDVRGCALTSADLGRLLDDDVAPAVRELWIGGQPIDDALLERLAAWPRATQLRKLHLGSAGVTDRGASALAASPQLSNVRSLVISGSRLKPETEAALVASPALAGARIFVGTRQLARKAAAPSPAKRKRAK